MPKFKGYLTGMKFDGKKALAVLQAQATLLNKRAAREAVRAIIIKVPVYTGMARGSIKFAKGRSGEVAGRSLYEFLNLVIPITPRAYRKNKNPLAGGKQGRFTFSNYRGRFNFTLSTSVTHYIINEWYEGQPNEPSFTRPWRSFDAGKKAYDDYINEHAKEVIPKLSKFIVRSNVPFGS